MTEQLIDAAYDLELLLKGRHRHDEPLYDLTIDAGPRLAAGLVMDLRTYLWVTAEGVHQEVRSDARWIDGNAVHVLRNYGGLNVGWNDAHSSHGRHHGDQHVQWSRLVLPQLFELRATDSVLTTEGEVTVEDIVYSDHELAMWLELGVFEVAPERPALNRTRNVGSEMFDVALRPLGRKIVINETARRAPIGGKSAGAGSNEDGLSEPLDRSTRSQQMVTR